MTSPVPPLPRLPLPRLPLPNLHPQLFETQAATSASKLTISSVEPQPSESQTAKNRIIDVLPKFPDINLSLLTLPSHSLTVKTEKTSEDDTTQNSLLSNQSKTIPIILLETETEVEKPKLKQKPKQKENLKQEFDDDYKTYITRSVASSLKDNVLPPTSEYPDGINSADEDEEFLPGMKSSSNSKRRSHSKYKRKRTKSSSTDTYTTTITTNDDTTNVDGYTWLNAHEFQVDCHICSVRYMNYDDYCAHLKLDHYDFDHDLQWLTCEICGKTNAHKSNFISHLASHTGIKPFKCKLPLSDGIICETEASTRQNLQTHMSKVHKMGLKHSLVLKKSTKNNSQSSTKRKSVKKSKSKKKRSKKRRKKKRSRRSLEVKGKIPYNAVVTHHDMPKFDSQTMPKSFNLDFPDLPPVLSYFENDLTAGKSMKQEKQNVSMRIKKELSKYKNESDSSAATDLDSDSNKSKNKLTIADLIWTPPAAKKRRMNIEVQRKYDGCHPLDILIAAAVWVRINKNNPDSILDEKLLSDVGDHWQSLIKPELLKLLVQTTEQINSMAETEQIY